MSFLAIFGSYWPQEEPPAIPCHYSDSLRVLVNGLLDKDPLRRFDGDVIDGMAFIQQRKQILHDSGGTLGTEQM